MGDWKRTVFRSGRRGRKPGPLSFFLTEGSSLGFSAKQSMIEIHDKASNRVVQG
jgi:hypothetical protein